MFDCVDSFGFAHDVHDPEDGKHGIVFGLDVYRHVVEVFYADELVHCSS